MPPSSTTSRRCTPPPSTATTSWSSCSCRPARTPWHGPMPATRPPTSPRPPATSTSRVASARSPRIAPRADRLRSAALEVALAVPRVDHRVVGVLLDPGRVEVVVDHVLAEDLDGRVGPFQLADRLVQRARHPLDARRQVAVALELGVERQL